MHCQWRVDDSVTANKIYIYCCVTYNITYKIYVYCWDDFRIFGSINVPNYFSGVVSFFKFWMFLFKVGRSVSDCFLSSQDGWVIYDGSYITFASEKLYGHCFFSLKPHIPHRFDVTILFFLYRKKYIPEDIREWFILAIINFLIFLWNLFMSICFLWQPTIIVFFQLQVVNGVTMNCGRNLTVRVNNLSHFYEIEWSR